MRPFDDLINIARRGLPSHQVDPLRLKDRLPRVRVPLKSGEPDVGLPLQDLIDECYDLLVFRDRLDDAEPPPEPRLAEADAAWADEVLRSAGLRR